MSEGLSEVAKSFKENEAAYYDLAVAEATKAGVKLNLGEVALAEVKKAA
jgi:hypothetical protein